ncbi:DNA adenine methylase [Geovibrio ferrireducens]|uniref:DNA adenine methylase n=1 Tax=Geovibrio ferrireducens TaxID=46201 RepID=UPI00224840E3|nr:DNA adenine methylase [Geovibrio ferrireducens]
MRCVIKALIGWLGGKSKLADTIVKKIPPHTCYVEVFCGGAHVYFTKEQSRVETINDINSDLVNLYRIAQSHLEEFIRQFKYMLVSREQFEKYSITPPESLTDIQRAVRFYYLIKTAFGAKLTGQNYGYSVTSPPRLNLLRIEEDLSAAHLRLSRTNIENLAYQQCICKYDGSDTFFYLDPPYFGCEDDYGADIFSRDDFGDLARLLAGIKGKFILSINDTPEIRAIFADFLIEDVRTTYTVGNEHKAVSELLIMNYEPKEELSIETFMSEV